MEELKNWIFGFLIVGSLLYLVYLRPMIERKQENRAFDLRVLGVIDGLYFSGLEFGCSDFEMRRYVKDQLSKAHSLPSGQFLMEYTTANGCHYHSQAGGPEHMLFAVLCLAQYAKEHNRADLLSWCESHMILAGKFHVHY